MPSGVTSGILCVHSGGLSQVSLRSLSFFAAIAIWMACWRTDGGGGADAGGSYASLFEIAPNILPAPALRIHAVGRSGQPGSGWNDASGIGHRWGIGGRQETHYRQPNFQTVVFQII